MRPTNSIGGQSEQDRSISVGSMQGKRVVITGPTSGIGKETAMRLASLGAQLVLGCRDIKRGHDTAEEISRGSDSSSIEVVHLDTSSQQAIREFTQHCREKYSRIEVLINNAGVNLAEQPRRNSPDGIELTFAINVLGYYLVTRELLDILKASAPARIINVASSFAGDLDLDDLQFDRRAFDGMKAYAQSKACDRLFTWALARRLEKSGVTANAVAPGLVPDTGLFRGMSSQTRVDLKRRGGGSIAQGADSVVWLASSPAVEGVSGKFYEQRQERPCELREMEVEEQLWDICETLVHFV